MIIVPSIKDSNSSASKSRLNHGFRMQESERTQKPAYTGIRRMNFIVKNTATAVVYAAPPAEIQTGRWAAKEVETSAARCFLFSVCC